jgi:hypothetical protein
MRAHRFLFAGILFYELMCHVLDSRPAPNDGRLAAVAHVLSAR